jgi:hypothetical protein
MIDPLGPAERALLAAGREALGPTMAQVARIKVGVAGAIAAGGAGAAAAGGASIVATKLAVVAVAAAAVGAGAYAHARLTEVSAPTVTTAPTATAVADEEPELGVAPRVAVAERELPPPPAQPAIAAPEPALIAAPPPRATLKREIELVDDAMQALRRRDFTAASAAIHSYQLETSGGGQLAEDAYAIEVEAMCASGDPDAPGKLAAFFERWPRSSQRPRLAAACP